MNDFLLSPKRLCNALHRALPACASVVKLAHRLALTATLAIALAPATAQDVPTRLVTQTRSALDEIFLQARNANARGQAAELEKMIGSANPAEVARHPLAMYLPYWQLRLRLQDQRSDPVGTLDAQVRDYLSKHTNTIAADLLRRDWLLDLGKRKEWVAFEAQYPLWALRDDNQVFCYELEMRAARLDRNADAKAAESLANAAKLHLQNTKEFNEGCASLLVSLVGKELITPADASMRVFAAIEANNLGHARRIAAAIPGLNDPQAFELSLSNPVAAIEQRRSRDLVLAAFARLARQNPEQAAALLKAREEAGATSATSATTPARADSGHARSLAWAWTAAALARKHHSEAAAASRKSLAGPAAVVAGLSADTHYWMARAALRETDWKLLAQLIDRMPDAVRDETWQYWRARAHLAAAEPAAANPILLRLSPNLSFYGQLAAEELGGTPSLPARAAPPSNDEVSAWNGNAGFLRARRFYELGLRFEGNREWNWQLRGLSDRQLLAVAEWARKEGMLDRTINTSDRTVSEFDFTQRFPTPLRDIMLAASKERQLDAASVYGLIRQESRFIQDVSSSVGARGLMQIMPATGQWIARKMGVKDFSVSRLTEPELNIAFGTFYLKTVLTEFDGSLALAAAAYNAGPGRSRAWRASLKQPVEAAIFAETIPFTETRDYVKKVLANAAVYGLLLTGSNANSAIPLKKRLGVVTPKQPIAVSDTP